MCASTNLPVCKDTIIVLIITVLNSISIITNFVIRKRDVQIKKHHTFWSTAGISIILDTVIEVRPIFAPFFLVVSPLGAIGNLRESAPTMVNAYNLVVYHPKATKLKT